MTGVSEALEHLQAALQALGAPAPESEVDQAARAILEGEKVHIYAATGLRAFLLGVAGALERRGLTADVERAIADRDARPAAA